MAQVSDYTVSNQTFPNTRADINNIFEAIGTNNSGTSAPTNQLAGQFWIDTTSSTWTLYIHDGSDDIPFCTIDTSANTVNFSDSALDVVTDTTPQLGGNLDLNSNDITGTGNINITGTATVSGDLTVDTDTLYVDSANNRVGVGTSSPDGNLEISNGTERHRVSFNTGEVYLMARNASSYITQEYIANQHVFTGYGDSSGNEALRIDSSGNVLVGKTTANNTDAGTTIYGAAPGNMSLVRDSGTCMVMNRLNTDGDIVAFRKDNTTEGSIGISFSRPYFANDTIGIKLGSTTDLRPTDSSGTNNDNAIDLGVSSVRFRHLYLGGNIYLGGTGSANALDDYETGTWTPAYSTQVSSFTSVTYDSITRGFYTKVGDVVFAQCHIRTDAITVGGASGDVYVDGFPFTVAIEDNEVHTAGGGIGYSTAFGGDMPSSYFCIRNDTKALLVYRTSANGSSLDLNVNDLGTGSNANTVIATFIYKAQ